jgi:hypothetical protein
MGMGTFFVSSVKLCPIVVDVLLYIATLIRAERGPAGKDYM